MFQAALGMVMPSLSQFIHPAPASLVSSVPTLWLEDCLAGAEDRLVLVDANHTPIRVLPLHHLLSIVEEWTSSRSPIQEDASETPSSSDRDLINLALVGYPPLAIAVVSISLPIETIVQMVAAAPETCWVVVDQHQRYLGLLDTPRLLAAVVTEQFSAPVPLEARSTLELIDVEPLIQTQHPIVQSNTALLTYLGHELKTPLTSLLGLSSLLRTERLGTLNTRQARYVSLIQQHCRRLAAWVNTLIDLGRVDSGTLRLVPHVVDLSAIWQEAYRQAALRIGHEGDTTPDLPPLLDHDTTPVTLVADPPRLQQMLTSLMQTALANRTKTSSENSEFPIKLEVWDNWIAFISHELDEALCLEHLSQADLALPFPATPAASTPISTEMGHWLEWLLVRKLAQLHGGDLVLMAHSYHGVCPTLVLPKIPAPTPVSNSRFVLFVTPAQLEPIKTLQQQAAYLNYRLLVTHQAKDAVDIATSITLFAILVMIEGPQSIGTLTYLKNNLETSASLVIALVPPQWSSFLGNLPADRELLWPAGTLENVLLQPPASAPAPNRLTILYLKQTTREAADAHTAQMAMLRLPHIFHDFGCRVLEVDDLEQAALLQRVWNPDVAVLDPAIVNPMGYLQTLVRSSALTSLPLITLTVSATQAAHRFDSLIVFPCLVGETPWDTVETSDRMAAWLIQVLQVAAARKSEGLL